jgi:hypothetical protein
MLTLTGAYSFRKPENWVTPRVYELTNTIIYDVVGKPENWVTPRVYELTDTIIYDVVGIRISIKDYGKDFRTIMSNKTRAIAYGYQVQAVF